MNIDNLTLGQIKEIKELTNTSASNNGHRFKIGEAYFIRTVTMHLIGKLVWVGDKELELSEASWIADSGRFHDALKTGELKEVEPFTGPVMVGRGSIVDTTVWVHDLPREQK